MPDGNPKDTERLINPEQKADSVLKDTESTELDLFQEYQYRSHREGSAFISRELSYRDLVEGNPYNILNLDDPIVQHISKGSPQYVAALKQLFNIPRPTEISYDHEGQLFCAIGEKDGKIVFQGGGDFRGDKDSRLSVRSFTVVLNAPTAANVFTTWLQESPNQALESVILKGIPEYDSERRIIGSAVKFTREIFKDPVKKLYFADLRTGEKTTKEFPQAS